jgi:hypothetical protein
MPIKTQSQRGLFMDQSKQKICFTWLLIVIVLAGWVTVSNQTGLASPAVVVDRSLEETQFTAPLDTFQGLPAYDSGWYALGTRPDPISVLFTHNLGGNPDNYFVHLTCKDDLFNGTYSCTDTALLFPFGPGALARKRCACRYIISPPLMTADGMTC